MGFESSLLYRFHKCTRTHTRTHVTAVEKKEDARWVSSHSIVEYVENDAADESPIYLAEPSSRALLLWVQWSCRGR